MNGNDLRALRERHGLKVVELAKALGYSKGYISGIENGHFKPISKTFIDKARAFFEAEAKPVIVRHWRKSDGTFAKRSR